MVWTGLYLYKFIWSHSLFSLWSIGVDDNMVIITVIFIVIITIVNKPLFRWIHVISFVRFRYWLLVWMLISYCYSYLYTYSYWCEWAFIRMNSYNFINLFALLSSICVDANIVIIVVFIVIVIGVNGPLFVWFHVISFVCCHYQSLLWMLK